MGKWGAFSPIFCAPGKRSAPYDFSKAPHLVLKGKMFFVKAPLLISEAPHK